MSSNLAIIINKEGVGHCQFIFYEASPNTLSHNKQSTPTPYRYIDFLDRKWIYDDKGEHLTIYPMCLILAKFREKDKAETLPKYVSHGEGNSLPPTRLIQKYE